MAEAAKGSPSPPPVTRRPQGRDEEVRYLRIDFQRCVIRRGTRLRTGKRPAPARP